MRILDQATKKNVQATIDANLEQLKALPGFVSAEPGFPIVDGAVRKEPAIVVFVTRKLPPTHLLHEQMVPRQLGPYRVSVMQADPVRQVMSLPTHADVATEVSLAASNLTYEPIDGNPIDSAFEVETPLLCHVGPDAGWPVLKPFLEATRHTLSVAMYDFNADYVAKTFIETVRGNDLQAVLTWDDSMTPPETAIRAKLKSKLKDRLDGWIVQCGSGRRFASAYHEKVAVRDSSAFWLSSGNWSLRSQPEIDPIADPASAKGMYGKGNREWHVIVEHKELAQLFERYIKYDRDGSEQEAQQGDEGAALSQEPALRFPDLFVPVEALIDTAALAAAVEPCAPAVLPAVKRKVKIQPVLTPDNYLSRILELFQSAQRSVYLQYAYINYSDKPQDKEFTDMLAMLADLSYRPNMDVRVIVGSNDAADKIRKLVEAGFNDSVFRKQRNIHNKGIVVDGKTVLISSANWSADGVLRNRDAGLIVHDADIAGYYESVFRDDWDNRATAYLDDDAPVIVAAADTETPAGMVRMSWRDYYG